MPSKQQMHKQEKQPTKPQTRKPIENKPDSVLLEDLAVEAIQKAKLDPTLLSSQEFSHLQGQIGNQATSRLVNGNMGQLDPGTLQMVMRKVIQRDGENPLTPAQVTKAINYYQTRQAQYTEAIIKQIQAGVGVTETGVVDEEMVQAVARYQQSNSPLKVDGMAGPRTLPALFPSGLAEQGEVDIYAAAAREVIGGDWASKTVEEKADAILGKVNDRLTEAGVPIVGKVIQDLGANEYGRFAFSLWSIRVNQTLLQSPTLTEAQAADLADTMYHEARHAEQWYRMAQLMAGQGKTAAEIATAMGIPPAIAALAFADPLEPGSMQALIADGWFQSVYGTGSAHRAKVLGPSGTFEEYKNLPEESDAWRVGTSVTDAYLAGGPGAGGSKAGEESTGE